MMRHEPAVRARLNSEGIDLLDRDRAVESLNRTVAPSVCIEIYMSLILPGELRKAGKTTNEKQLELFKDAMICRK